MFIKTSDHQDEVYLTKDVKPNLAKPSLHDGVMAWERFPRYQHFVRGIHEWIPLTKGQ